MVWSDMNLGPNSEFKTYLILSEQKLALICSAVQLTHFGWMWIFWFSFVKMHNCDAKIGSVTDSTTTFRKLFQWSLKMSSSFKMKLSQIPMCSLTLDLLAVTSVLSRPHQYASGMTEVLLKLLIVGLNNINTRQTWFLNPPPSRHLFSDQFLTIQMKFLTLGHAKAQRSLH